MKYGIGVKIALGFSIVIVLNIVVLAAYAWILGSSSDEIDKWIGIEYLVEADRDAYQSNLAFCQAIVAGQAGDSERLTGLIGAVEENRDQIGPRFDKFLISYEGNKENQRPEYIAFGSFYKQWIDDSVKAIEFVNRKDWAGAREHYFGAYLASFQAMRDSIDQITTLVTETGYARSALITGIAKNAYLYTALAVLLLSAAYVLIGFLTIRMITIPFKKFSSSLLDSSSILDSSSNQLSSSSGQLSSGASELASSVEEITASLEELQATVDANAANVSEANGLVRNTASGARLVSERMTAMRSALSEIATNSSRIGKIVKVIDDIAFQTNILALNAAVEAARAGDAGRGFAVVAEQVKSLAQKSAESARESAQLVEKALESIKSGEENGAGVEEAQSSAMQFSDKAAALLAEVEVAFKEQRKGLSQITGAVTQTNGVVQGNAANAEETNAASEEILNQAQGLKEVVTELSLFIKGSRAMERESGAEDKYLVAR